MKKTYRAIALATFTVFVTNHGIVHGDPDSSDEKAKFPDVPEEVWERLVREGKIADEAAPPPAAEAPPSRRKARGGSAKSAPPPAANGAEGAPLA